MKKMFIVPSLLLASLALGGAGAWALEGRAGERLDRAMAEQAQHLVPGGQVLSAGVTDSPALLADRRDHVQQTVVSARTADGHPVLAFIREYDRAAHRAESVSWQVGGVRFAPGWTGVRDDRGVWTNQARTRLGAQLVTVSAATEVRGDTVVVTPATVSVDGQEVPLADAPAAVQAALVPVTVALPMTGTAPSVRSVWFDEDGAAMDLRSRDVDTD